MPTPENPNFTEHLETPIISESLQNSGVSSVPANVTPVYNDQGKPITQTGGTNSGKIQLPGDKASLLKKAKGSINDAATWLARFFLRALSKQNANTNTN